MEYFSFFSFLCAFIPPFDENSVASYGKKCYICIQNKYHQNNSHGQGDTSQGAAP